MPAADVSFPAPATVLQALTSSDRARRPTVVNAFVLAKLFIALLPKFVSGFEP